VLSFVCLATATILLLYVRHRAWLLAIYVVTAGLKRGGAGYGDADDAGGDART
jgi:hypothetical protein